MKMRLFAVIFIFGSFLRTNWRPQTTNTEIWLWMPLIFAFGCGAYYSIDFEPSLIMYAGLMTLPFIAQFMVRRAFPGQMLFRQVCILMLVSWVSGFSYSGLRANLHSNTASLLSKPIDRVMVEGWVSDLSASGSGQRVEILVHSISQLSSAETPNRVRLTHRSELNVGPGRFVRCYGALRPPPEASSKGDYNFRRDAWFDDLGAVGFVYGKCRPGTLGKPENSALKSQLSISEKRRALAEHIVEHAGRGGGFAAALMSGDRSFLSAEDSDALRNVGLAHLLAISGLHMGLAAGVLYFGLFRTLVLIEPIAIRFPMQKVAAFGALVGITGYLIISGASISAQRAWIMAGVALLAVMLDKPVLSLRSLAVAMWGVLLLSPDAVLSPGFQMSFAATAALIATYQASFLRVREGNKAGAVQKWFIPLLVTSLVAGVATGPFALYHFQRVAPDGFLANVLVSPIVSFVSAPLAAFAAVTMPFGLDGVFLKGFGESLYLILQISNFIQEQGFGVASSPKPMPGTALVAIVLGVTIVCIHKKSGVVLGSILWLVASAMTALAPSNDVIYSVSGDVFLQTDLGWTEIEISKGKALAPLRFQYADEIDCSPDCQIAMKDAVVATVQPEQRRILFQLPNHPSVEIELLSAAQVPSAWRIENGNIAAIPVKPTPCRLWSTPIRCVAD